MANTKFRIGIKLFLRSASDETLNYIQLRYHFPLYTKLGSLSINGLLVKEQSFAMTYEISKVYNIGLLRYRDLKIRVCGKDSIPFSLFSDFMHNIIIS